MNERQILHLRLAQPTFEVYTELFDVLAQITPVVQALPPNAAVLDITGALRYFGRSPAGLADLVQTRLAATLGLLAAVGGARTRMLAQLLADTTELGGVRIVDDPGEALVFLHAQPVRALPGVGPVLERALVRYGVETVGQLADLPVATVQRVAGASTGRLLHERAHGVDHRTIAAGGPPAAIAATRRFERDVLEPDLIRRALLDLAGELGARLRASRQTCRQVELQVTYADRSHTVRRRTLREPTQHTPDVQAALYGLFTALGLERARVRAVTARVAELAPAAAGWTQLTLDPQTESSRALEPVLDKAANRFGHAAIQPAALWRPRSEPRGRSARR
ncbi:hypothetical protein ACFXPX_32705 [Kitasatospora sp. NPDC059146]|uniref:DNA polymerase Y family protein n=1 Tax=unclassified Kitasatospora TaxID=2633591 RepID=UPI0036AC297C